MNRAAPLRDRETATEKMILQIEAKIARLTSARTARITALQNIRRELARFQEAVPVAPEIHADRKD